MTHSCPTPTHRATSCSSVEQLEQRRFVRARRGRHKTRFSDLVQRRGDGGGQAEEAQIAMVAARQDPSQGAGRAWGMNQHTQRRVEQGQSGGGRRALHGGVDRHAARFQTLGAQGGDEIARRRLSARPQHRTGARVDDQPLQGLDITFGAERVGEARILGGLGRRRAHREDRKITTGVAARKPLDAVGAGEGQGGDTGEVNLRQARLYGQEWVDNRPKAERGHPLRRRRSARLGAGDPDRRARDQAAIPAG
ncbi:hypothetical protein CC_0073 [Caulobacter vibrioides CB15]|uniref:Uncharacterized protein n=1 Tax=Caulobacter vibrioides (strain ATCC 19089 / CIP 103742 / CB 15) TaxID=190650 RepID=Q9ABZ7_CAUVC|nr:hypothetical protein CC_0073 [Caulobacter vibrioides CB15]